MEKFPRYARYKDSGVDWIGEIPEHWRVEKAKYLWSEKEDRSVSNESKLLSVSQYSGVVPRNDDSRSESLINYKKCKPKDLVINIMLAWMGGLGISHHEGVVSPAYCVYRQKGNNDSGYLGYLYRTPRYLTAFAKHSKGVVPSRWRMYTEDFGQILTLLPPLKEQHRIADFLDQKTAEIDEAIEKKQHLVDLLKEQKTVLINRAVTRGLDPTVPVRDSGVGWIGEIPEHWQVKRLKYFSSVQSGITLGKSYSEKKQTEYPYLRVANVQYGYLKIDDIATIFMPEREAFRYLLRRGDILVTEGGDIDKLGRGTVWEGQIDSCLHQNHIFAVRIDGRIASEYYVSLSMSCEYGRNYFTKTANKTTNLASTNRTKLGNFPVVLPPKKEQLKIIQASQGIEKQYQQIIDVTSSELEKLNELKNTLISKAVTGKIKI